MFINRIKFTWRNMPLWAKIGDGIILTIIGGIIYGICL